MNIEVEIRSFISKEQYEELLNFFKQNGELVKEDYQETFYFDCEQDLRIQKNNFYSKIWLKKGEMHADQREEIEIKFDRNQFEALAQLFAALGFDVKIKWFRKRFEFKWNGVTVCLDFTRGYGHIIELEQMSSEENRGKELENLKQKLKSLNIEITPKAEFDKKFLYYRKNWMALTETEVKL